MLQLKQITKDYVTSSETVHALKGVSISFRKSEFVSILGPSGCGKTTLLNIIGGLDHYTDGDLLIGGRSTKEYRDRDWDVYRNHRVGFIFQSYNLIPHQTVLGNVELALTIAGIEREERVERAKRALDRVGLAGQYYKKPNQLSGGQCQRVAIARALVNDPEILLADEPTGALDTVTSVQIMDLIKEISEERLVIMVTHNPELAEQYSSRIVRLLDGNIIEDTNPMSDEEEAAEIKAAELAAKEQERLDEEAVAATIAAGDTKAAKKSKKSKKEKARMSFFTAFRLSARNLLSKRGRTTMVSIAGSIGIIGIALVLAFSAGIKGYIASMQDDMLSGNPITIGETAYDLDAFTGMMDDGQKTEIIKNPNRVYISSLIEYMARTSKKAQEVIVKNELTKEYIEYLKAMDSSNYSAMDFSYGISINPNLYTNITTSNGAEGEEQYLSIQRITDMYTQVLGQTEHKDMAFLIPMLAPSIQQAPSNSDYLLSQYELLDGNIASGKNEIMLVVDKNDELSDLLLGRYGYYTQDEFLAIIDKATQDEGAPNPENYRDSFAYNELVGKKFTYYPTNSVYSNIAENGLSENANKVLRATILAQLKAQYESMGMPLPGDDALEAAVDQTLNGPMGEAVKNSLFPTGYEYISNKDDIKNTDGALELTVVGILSPKDSVQFGSMSSGIYYTKALTDYVIEQNSDKSTGFMSFLANDANAEKLSVSYEQQSAYGLTYMFDFFYDVDKNPTTENVHQGAGIVSYSMDMDSAISNMMGSGESVTFTDQRDMLMRTFGGNANPNFITIFPKSFDEMYLVSDYLDKWNGKEDITYTLNGETKTITAEERNEIKYNNTLELVIGLINTMIDVVKYALIAFTSVSLVVSTVMIGIITYVSVVERIKEIGVIRSLGGRKKDVSHLFNAETFIIGGMSGLIGVLVTYLISIVVNLILKPLINYSAIAALPISNAILLVLLSIGLTLISGLIPASSAAKKDPVVALRTE